MEKRDKFGTTWKRVEGASAEQLRAFEEFLGKKLPARLRAVLKGYAGGVPDKGLFVGPDGDEFGLGKICFLESSAERDLIGSHKILREVHDFPGDYIAFAKDNGNANYYALRPDCSVVYFILNELEDPERYVAESLDDFLSQLEVDEDAIW